MKLKYVVLVGIFLLSIFIVGCVNEKQLKCLEEKSHKICGEYNSSIYDGFPTYGASLVYYEIDSFSFRCILNDRTIGGTKYFYPNEIKECKNQTN